MLTSMRKNAGSFIIKLLLGAIVVVFVLWGVGTNQKSSNPEVARVEGQAITYADFARSYQQMVDNIRRQFGSNLDDETLKALNIREQALNQVVDRVILVNKAQAMGFRVSDAELAAHIRNVPFFQSNGQFDRIQYERVLSQLRMTPEAFEDSQRDDLLIQKVSDIVARRAKVAEAEAADWYRWQNAAVNLTYVFFAPDRADIIDPGEDEIKAFFEDNQERYMTPPRRSARYLAFRAADHRAEVRLAANDVAVYYDEHPDEFSVEERIEARHILFKVDSDADQAAIDAARSRAAEIQVQIKAGGDFAELARMHSDDAATGAEGGYLGTFGRGKMVKPFEEAAFALAAGEISAPVRSEFGFHIIKVDRKEPARTRTLAEAEDKIRGQLTDSRARLLALEAAEAAYDLSYESEDLEAVAKELGHELLTTGMITRNQPVEGITDPTAFGRMLFGLSPETISEVQEIDGDFFIIQVEALETPQVPDLASVRERVVADWEHELRWEQAENQAKAFLLALNEGGAMEALSREKSLEPKSTGFFKRGDAIEGVGYLPAMAEAAFSLSAAKPLPENPARGPEGFYVFRFEERREPEGPIDPAQLDQARTQLRQRKQQQIFEDWMAAARSQADIEIDRSVLE